MDKQDEPVIEQKSSSKILWLILVALLLGAATAAYLMVSKDDVKTDLNTAKPITKQESQDAATKLVKGVYDPYIKGAGETAYNALRAASTTELLAKIDDPKGPNMDRYTCAQNTTDSVSYGTPKVDGVFATVPITEKFGQRSISVQVKVDLALNKIAAVTCPK